MNYQKIYDDLIERGLKRGLDKSLIKGYTESHHIYPSCMGGSDDKSNRVLLYADEHYTAHLLLLKIYKNLKYSNIKEERIQYRDLALACKAMTMTSQKNDHSKNKLYKWAREEWISSISGENHPNFNREFSDEHKRNLSLSAINRLKDKRNHPRYGKKCSEDTKKKLSNKLKGRDPTFKDCKHTEETKRKQSEVAKNRPKFKCLYCDMVAIKGNLTRFHNDNCKHKPHNL